MLAAHAATRGWKVIIGRKSQLSGSLHDLPRGLYLGKDVQSDSLRAIKYIKALGNTYAAMDEEGLVHEGGSSSYVKRRVGTQSLAETQPFCAWGEAQAEVVRNAQPTLEDRLAVTGNPRVDLWRPELHSLYAERVAQIRDRVGAFVLFPSNFANVIGVDRPQLTAAGSSVASAPHTDPAEHKRFDDYIALRRAILERLRAALVVLARELPSRYVLVVRPHPSEDRTFWAEVAGAEPRIIVRHDGPLTPWLLAADGIVHSNCTTGVEAGVAGIPAVAYAPCDESRFPMLPNQVSHVVHSDEALVEAVNSVLVGRWALPQSARSTIGHHVAALTGPLAAERMMLVFEPLPIREDRGDGRHGQRRGDLLRTLSPRGREWLTRHHRKGVQRSPRVSETLAGQKFPATTLREVELFLCSLHEIDPRLQGLRVSEVAPSLFRLEATDR